MAALHRRSTVALASLTIALLCSLACSRDQSSSSKQAGPSVQVVLTTGDQRKLLAPQPSISFGSAGTQNKLVITVDSTTQYQQMDGIGGSLTDSSAWLIWNKLDAKQQALLMQQLFSPTAGIGLSFLRQPMGASDFTVSGNYSYDDVPRGQTDPSLSNFTIAYDTKYIVPLLIQARAINPRAQIVALPWSPPAWMKKNGSMNGGPMKASYFPALAQYFVKFLQAYQQAGVPVYAVSVQNEPLNSVDTYPTEALSAKEESDFIANQLGPALQNAGFGGLKIFGYEHNWDNVAYPETVLASAAANYVAGTAFHCYAGDVDAQLKVQSNFPNKDIWFTECTGTVGSNFAEDLVWGSGHLLIGATRNWARSVSMWNLALDQNSGPTNGGCLHCRGIVTIDTSTSPASIKYNVEFYTLGQLSKFMVPGARRIASNSFGGESIQDVAFQNPDGSVVLFALNPDTAEQSFTVSWENSTFNYSLPAQSVATFEWK